MTNKRVAQAPPPGVVRLGTPDASVGRWWDTNNVRWRGGVLQPIGGSVIVPGSAVGEVPWDIITWHDNDGERWAAYGTTTKLWAYKFSNQARHDITPAGVGPIERPGPINGYGLNTYGTGLYGTPRTSSGAPPDVIGTMGDAWAMDTFGELLLVVPTQDGRLFSWDPNTPATVATVVTGAPTGNRWVVVTDQRHVVLLGAGGDPRNVAWSDQESLTVWTPTVSNLAGDLRLQTQAECVTAVKVSQGVLIMTTNDAHLMQYHGPPYAYGIQQVGAGCGPISMRCVISTGAFAVWPSWQNFWSYSGSVATLPCDVKDFFFQTINRTSGGITFGHNNSQFAEVWWDYPDTSGVDSNRYAVLNYGAAGNIWYIGRRERTAADRHGTLNYPVCGGASGGGGALFQHEIGFLDDAQPRASAGRVYAETATIALGEGDRRLHVQQIAVDAFMSRDQPAVGFRFTHDEEPFDTASGTQLYTTIHDGLVDVRFSGRGVRMRIEATRDVDWEIGRTRLMLRQGGAR